jgi:hypothetical protein
MPALNVHISSCLEKYGYGFKDIHIWMDEPVKVSGANHRKYRHDPRITSQQAEHIFWDKVPEEHRAFIKEAVLDHIILDKKISDKDVSSEEDKYSNISVSLPQEQLTWLNDHPKINRSQLLQGTIEYIMHPNTNLETIKQPEKNSFIYFLFITGGIYLIINKYFPMIGFTPLYIIFITVCSIKLFFHKFYLR